MAFSTGPIPLLWRHQNSAKIIASVVKCFVVGARSLVILWRILDACVWGGAVLHGIAHWCFPLLIVQDRMFLGGRRPLHPVPGSSLPAQRSSTLAIRDFSGRGGAVRIGQHRNSSQALEQSVRG